MKAEKITIRSRSTINQSGSSIQPHQLYPAKNSKTQHKTYHNKNQQMSVSIFYQNINKNIQKTHIFEEILTQRRQSNKNILFAFSPKLQSQKPQVISVLQKIFFKKKRYCFQILKQFYLFTDQTESSFCSLSTYNPLIFTDEIIHSLFKILETKVIENKIWGFLNLNLIPYFKAAKLISQKSKKIEKKIIRLHKKEGFYFIKKASEQYLSFNGQQSRFSEINSFLLTENKETQCNILQKEERNQIRQQIIPAIQMNLSTNKVQSTTRIFTPKDYERQYEKQKNWETVHQPTVIGFTQNNQSSRRYKYKYSSPCHSELGIGEPKQRIRIGQKEIKKYNIIHYYERPKKISPNFKSGPKQFQNRFNNYVFVSCCRCHCCCCNFKVQQTCQQNSHKFDSKISYKNNLFRQKNGRTETNESDKNQLHLQNQSIQFSQLESKIDYLNFLRSFVKQQQQEAFR